MSYSEQPSPYSGMAMLGAGAVPLLRMASYGMPDGAMAALLMPMGLAAVLVALLTWLFPRMAAMPRTLAALLLAHAGATGLEAAVAETVNLPAVATVVVGVGFGAWLLVRTGLAVLGAALVYGTLAAVLDLRDMLEIAEWTAPMVALGVHFVLGCIITGIALAAWQAQRAERDLAAFDDEAFS